MPTLGDYKDPKKRAAADRALLRAVNGPKKRKPKDPLAALKRKHPGPWTHSNDRTAQFYDTAGWFVWDANDKPVGLFRYEETARAIAKLGGGK